MCFCFHIDAVTQKDWAVLSLSLFLSLSHSHWWFLFMTFFLDLQKLVLFNKVIKSVCSTRLPEKETERESGNEIFLHEKGPTLLHIGWVRRKSEEREREKKKTYFYELEKDLLDLVKWIFVSIFCNKTE